MKHRSNLRFDFRPVVRTLALALVLAFFFTLVQGQQRGEGAQAVLRAASELSLTDRQKAKIQKIMSDTAAKYRKTTSAKRGDPDLSSILAEIRRKGQEEALKELTLEQRKLWEKGSGGGEGPPGGDITSRSLIIPTIEQMKKPPYSGAYGPSADLVKTESHPVDGNNYIILTDHTDSASLDALQKLADHRRGELIRVPSLRTIHKDRKKGAALRAELSKKRVKYIAIAPKVESYRENLHLFLLKLLSTLDNDTELDAFPGYLVAGNSKSLADLVDRTIKFSPLTKADFKPVSIGAIEDANSLRYRSYQKAKVIQRLFADEGQKTPSVIITTKKSHTIRDDFPDLTGQGDIAMLPESERQTFAELSPDALDALNQNNILFMFGHGTTNRICGTEIDAFSKVDFSNEIVFCGSCMSATPYDPDRVDLASKRDHKRFAFHAVDNGAVMLLGHMGLCGGFPKVFPMAELVLEGVPAGEAWQRLMNSLITKTGIPDYYPENPPQRPSQRDLANGLLYVLWGDPALVAVAREG